MIRALFWLVLLDVLLPEASLAVKVFDRFDMNGNDIKNVGDFEAFGQITFDTSLAGPLKATSGVVSSGAIDLSSSEVSGVLPVSKGGTNSSAALSNNRIMRSTGGAITEASAITASRALISDANGIPTHATTTATEIGYVNGVTSSIQTQLNGKEATITTLPVSKGGTNSGTALSNNRVMVSDGGAIKEAAAITASRALTSDANGLPVASATTATELGYVNGVTSSIQTQLDNKVQQESGSFTISTTGAATTSANVNYTKIGRVVTLQFPQTIVACSSTASLDVAAGTVATALRPISDVAFMGRVISGGSSQATPGLFLAQASGGMRWFKTGTASSFDNTGNCGFYSFAISYLTSP